MAAAVSLKGIDEALANLSYKNPQALKSRLVHTIRAFYEDEKASAPLKKIDAERLIKALWDTGDDPAAIKTKRKNLSSTKSSVNSDLRKLFKGGKNPEGVIIGRDNLFVMSDEAKDKLISTFDASSGEDPVGSLKQIAQSLNAIQEALSKPDILDEQHSSEASATLEDLRSTVQQLSQKIASREKGDGPGDAKEEAEKTGKIDQQPVDDTVVEDAPSDEVVESLDEPDAPEPLDEAVVDDEEVIDEIVEPDELDDEDVETVDDDDLEEVLEDVDEPTLEQQPDNEKVVDAFNDGKAQESLSDDSLGGLQGSILSDVAQPPGNDVDGDVEGPEPLDDVVDDDLDVVDEIVETDDLDEAAVDDDDLEEVLEDVDDAADEDTFPDDEAAPPDDVVDGDGEETESLEDDVVDDLDIVDEVVETDALDEDVETVDDDDLEEVLEDVDEPTLKQQPDDEKVVDAFDDGKAQEGLSDDSLGGLQDSIPSDVAQPPVDDVDGDVDGDVEGPEPLEDVVDDDLDVVDEIVETDDLDEATVDDDDLEEVLEAVDDDSNLQDSELDEKAEFGDSGENAELSGTAEEIGLPADSLGEELDHDLNEESEKARRLAEIFDGYLGTMERFYNQFLLIPEGSYKVGSAAPKRDERPQEIVHIPAFYVGKFPVTNALFEVFVDKTGYVTTAEKVGYGTVYYGRLCKEVDEKNGAVRFRCNGTVHSKTVEGAFWYQPSGPGSTLHKKRDHPVVQVSLEDAMAYASWTGKRLPKEDEWEAAARSAQGYVFPWGNEWKGGACNIEDHEIADTTPVDTFKEVTNQLAIVDTLGNVQEWTSDVFPSTEQPRNSSRHYIAKGGSWVSGKDIRLFHRTKIRADTSSNILGFRCMAQ